MKIEHLKKFEKEMIVCTRCSYCKVVCPILPQIELESSLPRSRVMLSYGLLENEIDGDESVIKSLYQCTKCKNCEIECPSNVEITEIVKAARCDLLKENLILNEHKAIKDVVEKYGNPYGEERNRIEGHKKEKAELVLYLGCTGPYREEEAVNQIIKLFEELELDFTLIDETCCGMILLEIGHQDIEIEKYVEHNLREIEKTGAKKVIFICPGCYKTFKKEYPKIRNFDFELQHISEFLQEYDFNVKTDKKVTYHDPCDLGRHLEIYNPPRDIINKLAENFIEMDRNKENAACCGAGGGVRGVFPKLSVDISKNRVNEADKVADILLTECPACLHNLRNAKKRRHKIEIYSIAEYIQRLREENKKHN